MPHLYVFCAHVLNFIFFDSMNSILTEVEKGECKRDEYFKVLYYRCTEHFTMLTYSRKRIILLTAINEPRCRSNSIFHKRKATEIYSGTIFLSTHVVSLSDCKYFTRRNE